MLQAVPREVHQVGDHLFFAGFAHIEPPLPGERHHAHQRLGVNPCVLSADVVIVELPSEQVFHLRCDVDDQTREGSAGLRDG